MSKPEVTTAAELNRPESERVLRELSDDELAAVSAGARTPDSILRTSAADGTDRSNIV